MSANADTDRAGRTPAGAPGLRERFRPLAGGGRAALWLTAGVVVMFGFHALQPSSQLIYLAISIAIFAVAASGLALLYGDCGLLSVAHGGIVGLGAYTTIMALASGFSELEAFFCAIAFGVVAAVLIGGPSLRLQGHYYVVTTFAAAETMGVVASNLGWLGGTAGKSLPYKPSFLRTESGLYYSCFVTLIAVVCVLVALRRAPFGGKLIAIRENETLARSLGVRTKRFKVATFALSGGICGLAGFFFAFANQYVSPQDVGSAPGIALVMILILGGSRHWLGPIVGAVVYYGLPYIFPLSALQNQLAIGVLLIAVILILPQGLVGAAQGMRRHAAERFLPRLREAK
jgi:branched-chain amino acid transport system permease protein